MNICHQLNLKSYNSYQLDAIAETAYFPETVEEIIEAKKMPDSILIGGGNNIIFTKEYYTEPLIIVRDNFSGIELEGNKLRVKAGTDLKVLSEFGLEHELAGLEYFYDIPGTVGGAIVMNAGGKTYFFSHNVESVTYYDIEQDCIKTIPKEECEFSYRHSLFSRIKAVVLEAVLSLEKGTAAEIKDFMESKKKTRWEAQPRNYPNAGSVFKRPEGYFVGPMLTELGLRGFRIGDAMVSEKHAGFIVNVGHATASDILELIQHIKQNVNEKYGIMLELEQCLI